MGLVAVLCFAACRGDAAAPSEETYHPAWCPRPRPEYANDPDELCIWMLTEEECEQQFEHRVECVPWYDFACYGGNDYCFRTLAACERARTRDVASRLKQHRDRIGPCTIYRVKH